jgi:lambda family phage portal protein
MGAAVNVKESAVGGALEGAERTNRETFTWNPPVISPDQMINPVKEMADARTRDSAVNDGYITGARGTFRDSIVGAQYRLNAKPDWRVLGVSQEWAEEFAEIVEARFSVIAESENCYLDAAGRNTFTGIIRLGVVTEFMTGEIIETAEWIKDPLRPISTAVQMVSSDRLSNPNGVLDEKFLRRGVALNRYGAPVGYWFRESHPSESYIDGSQWSWKFIPAQKPWGRKQVFHSFEQMMPAQSRGIADMVAALKETRMAKRFRDVTLQQAVIAASYAAAIESELPGDVVFQQLGGGAANGKPFDTMAEYLTTWMTALQSYMDSSKNIAIDQVRMPVLFPGTKLNIKSLSDPAGVGTEFEQSLHRHTAACLGLSYEEFTADWTRTNYSSARASGAKTQAHMMGKKKVGADRLANFIYSLYLEEDIAAGNIPLPPGKQRSWFYEPLVKDALCRAKWIGSGRGQIDELKETQSALLRIKSGLSTREIECSRLGSDFRDILDQLEREEAIIKKKGLTLSLEAKKDGAASAKQTMDDNQADDKNNGQADEEDDEL